METSTDISLSGKICRCTETLVCPAKSTCSPSVSGNGSKVCSPDLDNVDNPCFNVNCENGTLNRRITACIRIIAPKNCTFKAVRARRESALVPTQASMEKGAKPSFLSLFTLKLTTIQ